MRQTWLTIAAAPVIAAAMLTACTRHVGDDEGGSGSDRRKYAGGKADEIIGVKGCLVGAPERGEYVLHNVQLEPLPSQPTDALTSVGVTITEGATVRLRAANAKQLEKHLGQIVSVTGEVLDDGRSTIGTGGRPRDPDQQENPTDASRAAASEHHSEKQSKEAGPLGLDSVANGTVPVMAVEKINSTGKPCRTEVRPGSR
jgi:hypothetical protein